MVRRPAVVEAKPDDGRVVMRGGSGLGDSIYVQSVARHFIERGKLVEVCTFYPQVFLPLNGRVIVSDFRRSGVRVIAHYVQRKTARGTDMFQDCCLSAGIQEPVDLRLDWMPIDPDLVAKVRKRRPSVAVLMPRWPMARRDGFGMDLMPNYHFMQKAITYLRRKGAYIVQLGSGDALHRFESIDLDLTNRTSVLGLLDAAYGVDAFFGYCSFFVPLAESLKKPALFAWSGKVPSSSNKFVRTVLPEKVLHCPQTSHVVWDCRNDEELHRTADAFLVQARSQAVL